MDPARALGAHLIRFVAASQATAVLVLHGAWLLLVAATWGSADGGGDFAALGRPLVRAFAWLGGIGPDGHGDAGNVAQAMGLLTLPFYVLASLRKALRKGQAPSRWPIHAWAFGSGAIAFAGFALGMWKGGGLSLAGVAGMAALFAALTAIATAWAVAADRFGAQLAARLESPSRD